MIRTGAHAHPPHLDATAIHSWVAFFFYLTLTLADPAPDNSKGSEVFDVTSKIRGP